MVMTVLIAMKNGLRGAYRSLGVIAELGEVRGGQDRLSSGNEFKKKLVKERVKGRAF